MTVQAGESRSWLLPHDLSAARAARDHVGEFLTERQASLDTADALTLIASELAVNAVRHGAGAATLTVAVEDSSFRVSVAGSATAGDPSVGSADELATSGRGLAIVASLAQDWGWSRDDDIVTVWALA